VANFWANHRSDRAAVRRAGSFLAAQKPWRLCADLLEARRLVSIEPSERALAACGTSRASTLLARAVSVRRTAAVRSNRSTGASEALKPLRLRPFGWRWRELLAIPTVLAVNVGLVAPWVLLAFPVKGQATGSGAARSWTRFLRQCRIE